MLERIIQKTFKVRDDTNILDNIQNKETRTEEEIKMEKRKEAIELNKYRTTPGEDKITESMAKVLSEIALLTLKQ